MKTTITKLKIILIIVSLMVISACNQQHSSTTDSKEFQAFLKLKRISADDEARVQRMFSQYQYRQALADAIAKSDELDTTLIQAEIEEYRKELLISRYFESYLAGAVTDQGIQNFYSENADSYKSRKVKVSHILFRVNPRMSEPERQVVLTAASEAYSRINSGEKFEDVARSSSQDKISAEKGGDLGWLVDGAISKAFSEKVFSMQTGEVSPPFLTDFGFHIIKVTESPQDVIKPLEAMKGDIRYQLRSKSKKAETARLLESVGYTKAD